MGDPLSISAAVIGIVAPVLQLLKDDVDKIIDAPWLIKSLHTDLDSTYLALKSMEAIEESEWEALGAPIAEQFKDAVKTCGSACETFRADLQRWTRRSRGNQLSWRDRTNIAFLKERQIKAMSEHLYTCRLACSSVVGTSTLCSTLRNGDMTQDLMDTILARRDIISIFAKETDNQLVEVQRSLEDFGLREVDPEDIDEEDDRNSAGAQLDEQKTALEAFQKLFLELQSKLREQGIERVAEQSGGRRGNTTVSIGNVTGGLGIGINNASISDIRFGNSPETGSDRR